MKRTLSSVGAAAICSVVGAASCAPEPPDPGPDAGPERQCEVDLSIDLQSSEEVEPGAPVEGFLCPQRDADFWAFDVEQADSVVLVHLTMSTFLTPVEPAYTLLKEDGTALATARDPDKSAGEAVDFTGAHRVDEPGRYVVRVADVEGLDDRFDVASTYALTVEVVPNPDDGEPNDVPDQATAIASGSPVQGVLATTGDQDWFAVPVESDARIIDAVITAPSGGGIEPVVELYAADAFTLLEAQTLKESPESPGALTARIRAPAAGQPGTRFFLRVHDDDDTDADVDPAVGGYTLTATVLADPDANEAGPRNDAAQTATAATSGQTVQGALATRGDQDLFRLAPPAATTADDPKVLIVEVTFDGPLPEGFVPQLRVLAHDPEVEDAALQSCTGGCPDQVCLPTGTTGERCGEARLQRVLSSTTYRAGFALRRPRSVFVSLNELGDDLFQEQQGYSIRFEVIDDPDPGERGDDYLIPNLQSAGYANEEDLDEQEDRSMPRARDLGAGGILPACPTNPDTGEPVEVDAGFLPDGGGPAPSPDCLPVVPVPAPGPGGQRGYTVDCNGESARFEARGRISYEGDRDWFRFEVPSEGYWALDFTYAVSRQTPVELTFFVHTSGDLIANDLEPEEIQDGPVPCGLTPDTQCPSGSVCVDARCWAESAANPAFTAHVFPDPALDECAYVHVNDDRADDGTRPIFLEVTDNGINDFDPEMEYAFDVLVRCGCPAACDGSFSACQGVAPPP